MAQRFIEPSYLICVEVPSKNTIFQPVMTSFS